MDANKSTASKLLDHFGYDLRAILNKKESLARRNDAVKLQRAYAILYIAIAGVCAAFHILEQGCTTCPSSCLLPFSCRCQQSTLIPLILRGKSWCRTSCTVSDVLKVLQSQRYCRRRASCCAVWAYPDKFKPEEQHTKGQLETEASVVSCLSREQPQGPKGCKIVT
eukprot:4107783-Amphidinium_carterae.1